MFEHARKVLGELFLILLGVAAADTRTQADYLADKLLGLRILADDSGKMNRSIVDTAGAILVVSQFTLYGDTRNGRRPGFAAAAPPGLRPVWTCRRSESLT